MQGPRPARHLRGLQTRNQDQETYYQTQSLGLRHHQLFKDHHRPSTFLIQQFTRVLKKLEILPPEPAYRKLVNFYSSNHREIDYLKFCDAIDDT
jgi:hypothetical protein